MTLRVTIVSRIFAPEVSAAAGLLTSWARAFRDRGCDVEVITTDPPRGMVIDDLDGIRVRRAAVLRDRQQYVRGYVSYLSYDVPLFFRLLFSRRSDLYVVEPPPTTVAVARIVGALRRTPYVVDAADLWSDAAAIVTRSPLVLWPLRRLELWGLRGARHLLAAHEPLVARFRDLRIATPASGIGFGADTDVFRYSGEIPPDPPVFVYAGTHSEWHGAGVFVEAFAQFLPHHPGSRLRFIGNGQEREVLRARAVELGISDAVSFEAPIPPTQLAPILAGATGSLASLKPGQGYDYAFTTKAYSSLAAGCPVLFAGIGPTVHFLREAADPDAGVAVAYSPDEVATQLERMAAHPLDSASRARLSAWTHATYSLDVVAQRVVDVSLAATASRGSRGPVSRIRRR
jgi:glycosyltransferase involved in cell wall biosynthesis